MGESQQGPGGWASMPPHACLDRAGGRLPDHRQAPQLWPDHPETPEGTSQTPDLRPCPLARRCRRVPSLPARDRLPGTGTHRSLPVGVGEDSVDLHVAPVGLGHVHPQLPAARLPGAVQTRHIVAVVVLLSHPRQSPPRREGSGLQEPPSAPPPPRPLALPGSWRAGPEG